ncbi:MAG: hypothetical protein CVU71_07040 [Deltaproteobacteria bacterium HGW-Deltaproteobacteria-6]|nr:MAG: hypothetical protein CVU71_07040 [Deltaproteobacteria bacterium HGW-Deltaproteobacteria-6]
MTVAVPAVAINEKGGEDSPPFFFDIMIQDDKIIQKLDTADDLLKQGKYGEAIALLENIHGIYPREESVLLRLAWASWDNGDKACAISYWEMLLDRELQRKVFTGFAYDELVRIYKQERQNEKLVALCEKAVSVQTQDVGLLEELGTAYFLAGRSDKACDVFKKLASLEEDNPAFWCRLGEALFAAGRAEESETAYLQAGKIDPEQVDRYYFKIADLFARDGRHAEAKRLLEKCTAANPSQPLYYCCLGDELIGLGKTDEALLAYETAARLDQGSAGTYYNRMGNTFMKEKLFGRAAAAFQKAIDYENLPPYCQNLAAARKALGQT